MVSRSLENRLLSYLLEHPGSSPREIADALGEPLGRIRSALARLRDRGLVARGEEGRYYAVVTALAGIPAIEVRREVNQRLVPDQEALTALLSELAARVEKLEEKLDRLEAELERLKERWRELLEERFEERGRSSRR